MSKVRRSSWMRLVSAVLVALMGMGTVGVGTASSQEAGNYVLYPFIVKDNPNVVTLITYMGPNFSTDLERVNALHYQYHAKATSSTATATCAGQSVVGDTSPNDVLTYDSSGFFGIQPIFDDDTSLGPNGLNLITTSASFAYLLINSTDVDAGLANGGPNYGEAQVVDLANGGLWGYTAVAIPSGSDGQGIGGGVALISGTRRPVHLYPPTAATTNFAVTPTGTDMMASSNNRARLQMQLTTGAGGVYDRNENPIDFVLTPRTRCVWVFPLVSFVGAATLERPTWRASGGWAWLANRPDTSPSNPLDPDLSLLYENNAIVFKIISAGSAGSFVLDGQPVFTGLCGFDSELGCGGIE